MFIINESKNNFKNYSLNNYQKIHINIATIQIGKNFIADAFREIDKAEVESCTFQRL